MALYDPRERARFYPGDTRDAASSGGSSYRSGHSGRSADLRNRSAADLRDSRADLNYRSAADLAHVYPSFGGSMDLRKDWAHRNSSHPDLTKKTNGQLTAAKRTQPNTLPGDPPCCSYRVKTAEKHARYASLHRLRFRALYKGLVEYTTAHGLPHIHIAQGFVKKTFWIVLTLALTATWLWNAQDVLLSFMDFDVTVKYDIRSEPKLLFPAVTICNQNVAKRSKLLEDAIGSEILGTQQQMPPYQGGPPAANMGGPQGGNQGGTQGRMPGGIQSDGQSDSQGTNQDSGRGGDQGGKQSGSQSGTQVGSQGGDQGSMLGGRQIGGQPEGEREPLVDGPPPRDQGPGQLGPGTAPCPAGSSCTPPPNTPPPRGHDHQPPASGGHERLPSGPRRPPTGGNLGEERSSEAQRREEILEYLASLDLDTKERYGHGYYPTVASCEFGGYPCYNTSFKRFYDATYGNCYTFNTGSNDTDSKLFAHNTGPQNGLAIEFGIEQQEYLGSITSKAGMRVAIHPPTTPPFPADFGIDIAPGVSTSIGIRKVLVSRLGGRYSDCINQNNSNVAINVYEEVFPWTNYTIIACQNTCYQKEVIKTCNCSDKNFPDFGQAFSSIRDSELPLPVCNSTNSDQADCKSDIYTMFINGSLKCPQCLQPCDEEYYSLTMSSSLWPADNYVDTFKERYEDDFYLTQVANLGKLSSEVGLLEVYYESLNMEEMIEQPAYETSQFIADIGGSVGLWLGASVMSIFEFIEFFLDAFILLLAKTYYGPARSRSTSGSRSRSSHNNNHTTHTLPAHSQGPIRIPHVSVPEIVVTEGTPNPDPTYATNFDDIWHHRKMARGVPWPGHTSNGMATR